MFSYKFLIGLVLSAIVFVAVASFIVNVSTPVENSNPASGNTGKSIPPKKDDSAKKTGLEQPTKVVQKDISPWPFVVEAIILAIITTCFAKGWTVGGWIAVAVAVAYPFMYIAINWPQYLPTMIGFLFIAFGLYLFTKGTGAAFAGLIIIAATVFMFLTHLHWLDPFFNAMDTAVEPTVLIDKYEPDADFQDTDGDETRKAKSIERKSVFDTPEPVEKVFQLKSLEGGKLCGLPKGKYKITARQTQLHIKNKVDGSRESISSILGGLFGPPATDLPYQEKNYNWGILFENKPSGSSISIKDKGCVQVSLNIDTKQRVDWYALETPSDIYITIE